MNFVTLSKFAKITGRKIAGFCCVSDMGLWRTDRTRRRSTSMWRISLCSWCRNARKRWKVSFWSSPRPKKYSASPVFIDFNVLPVTAWSRCLMPTLLWDLSTSRTYMITTITSRRLSSINTSTHSLSDATLYIRYDAIVEFNVDSKAEYTALSSTRSQKKKLKRTTPVPL